MCRRLFGIIHEFAILFVVLVQHVVLKALLVGSGIREDILLLRIDAAREFDIFAAYKLKKVTCACQLFIYRDVDVSLAHFNE